jgi:hypothetical protein
VSVNETKHVLKQKFTLKKSFDNPAGTDPSFPTHHHDCMLLLLLLLLLLLRQPTELQ